MVRNRWGAGGKLVAMADDGKGGMGGGGLRDLVKAESMVQLALALPVGCFLGLVIGRALDEHFHATWMGLTGLLLGAVGGFIQIFRVASQAMKKDG